MAISPRLAGNSFSSPAKTQLRRCHVGQDQKQDRSPKLTRSRDETCGGPIRRAKNAVMTID